MIEQMTDPHTVKMLELILKETQHFLGLQFAVGVVCSTLLLFIWLTLVAKGNSR